MVTIREGYCHTITATVTIQHVRTSTNLFKECLGSIIVLNVLIHPGLFGGEGCAVVSKQQGLPQSNLCKMKGVYGLSMYWSSITVYCRWLQLSSVIEH